MAKKANEQKKLLLALALPALIIAYQFIGPYFAETKKLGEEAKKINEQIRQVKMDALLYSDDWEKKNSEKEKEIAQVLPELITPSEVLRYFATNFEKDHPGVQFTSLIPSPPTLSSIVADKENQNVKARVSKVQIKARIPPEHMLAYLEWVEKYPGLSRVAEVNFNSQSDGKNPALDVEMVVELYLVPKDWLKKPVEGKGELVSRSIAATASMNGTGWFELQTMDEVAKETKEPEAKDEPAPPPPKRVFPPKPPKFQVGRFVGGSIVVGEELFEEGDKIQGWQILKVDPKTKTVVIQREKTLYKVVVK